MTRIERRFAKVKAEKRAGLVTFIAGGDPDAARSQVILNALPSQGADFIELGMNFSDPMADGPAIQDASRRALLAGSTLRSVLAQARDFRATDADTPLILMGYYNPIYTYGAEAFARDAGAAGVDALIIVDLPPEEDAEIYDHARAAGLDIIRLVTPVTDEARLDTILERASGFIYYVSIAGVTGTASADADKAAAHIKRLRAKTDLPIAAGFGINTPDDARAMARAADAVVVGSALARTIGADGDVGAQVRGLQQALSA